MSDDFQIAEKETFNMGQGYYARCNELLTKIQQAKLQGNKTEWYMCLYCLFSELHAKCNPKQKLEVEGGLKDLLNYVEGRKLPPDFKLLNFELALRQVMEDKHMLTPKSEDPSAALGRM